MQLSESKLSRHAQLKPNGLENCHVFSTWSLQRTIKLIYLNNFEHLQQRTCVALCKCKSIQQGKIEKNNMCCNRNKITYFYTPSHAPKRCISFGKTKYSYKILIASLLSDAIRRYFCSCFEVITRQIETKLLIATPEETLTKENSINGA